MPFLPRLPYGSPQLGRAASDRGRFQAVRGGEFTIAGRADRPSIRRNPPVGRRFVKLSIRSVASGARYGLHPSRFSPITNFMADNHTATIGSEVWQEVLGYLNFSSGSSDPRLLGNLNKLFERIESAGTPPGQSAHVLHRQLVEKLGEVAGLSRASSRSVVPSGR
jgi:hypothetical protein